MSRPANLPTGYANGPESDFSLLAYSKGWTTTKRGWPDFLVTDENGEKFVVEVKPRTIYGRCKMLKESQADALDWFESLGVRCYVSDGKTLEPYNRKTHRPKSRSG